MLNIIKFPHENLQLETVRATTISKEIYYYIINKHCK